MSSVIVLEFNELTPSLMNRFIDAGKLPNFKRLRDEGLSAVTDAEEEPPALEPWIQWVTVHTGLSYGQHKVFDLGDGAKLKAPRIWDMASRDGKKSWICGSMNGAVEGKDFNGLLMPDPWSTDIRPIPEETFQPFFHFVRTYVQEYTAERPPLTKADYLRFMRFMAAHGLSLRTIKNTLKQLTSEVDGRPKWRRAAILDALCWDVFKHVYKREKPALSTFFLNSTAHLQHYYWRNMEPEAFAIRPSDVEQREYADAVLFGYQKMDEVVGDVLKLAGDEASVVLCTALSQQPLTMYDETGGKQLFKARDPSALTAFAGIKAPYTYAPVMAEEFHLYFKDEATAEDAERRLVSLKLATGEPVMRLRRDGAALFGGCQIYAPPAGGAEVTSPYSNQPKRFDDLFYVVDTGMKSGMHHPDGILWIRPPGGRAPLALTRKVSLREVAPTLLKLAGVKTDVAFAFPPIPELDPEAAPAAASGPDAQAETESNLSAA